MIPSIFTITTQILVIGAGSGGLTAAIGLAKVGYKVLLVEKELIGGDCTNFGCIPSKALLYRAKKAADLRKQVKENNLQIDSKELEKISLKALEDTRQVVKGFQEHESLEWLESFGIEFLFGKAKFVSKNQIKVIDSKDFNRPEVLVNFQKAIISTGSKTLIPLIDGLLQTPFLTNETIFNLTKVPKTLTILGNGPIGIEMAVAFCALGSKVVVIGTSDVILQRSEKTLAIDLQKNLEKEGIKFLNKNTLGVTFDQNNQFELKFEDGEMLKTDQLLIATGRKPNLDLQLENAKIESDKKGIFVNKFAQTNNKNIYAVGDCAKNMPNFTHFADYMSKAVVTNLAIQKYLKLPINISKIDSSKNPSVVYTYPELAQTGLTELEANKQYGKVKVYQFDLTKVDRIKATGGFGKISIVTTGFFGRIVGVHILADRAGEMLPEFQYLVTNKKPIRELSKIIRSYPTYTSGIGSLAVEWILGIFKK